MGDDVTAMPPADEPDESQVLDTAVVLPPPTGVIALPPPESGPA